MRLGLLCVVACSSSSSMPRASPPVVEHRTAPADAALAATIVDDVRLLCRANETHPDVAVIDFAARHFHSPELRAFYDRMVTGDVGVEELLDKIEPVAKEHAIECPFATAMRERLAVPHE